MEGFLMTSQISNLSWSLLGLATDEMVASELLSICAPSIDTVNLLPSIKVEVDPRTSSSVAKLSLAHAHFIAASSSSTAQALDLVSKFARKTTKRIVAANANAGKETVEFLFRWCHDNDEMETLETLLNRQHPSKWWDVYQEHAYASNPDTSLSDLFRGYSEHVRRFAANAPEGQLATLAENIMLLSYKGHSYTETAKLLVDTASHIESSLPTGRKEDYVRRVGIYINGIKDRNLRVKTLILTASVSPHPLNADKDLVDVMLNSPVATAAALVARSSYPNLTLSGDSVSTLLASLNPWAPELVANAMSDTREWSDDQVREVARNNASTFARYQCGYRNLTRLTVEDFAHIVRTAEPSSWVYSRHFPLVDREEIMRWFSILPAAESLQLALLLAPVFLRSALEQGDILPSFSPQEYLDAVSGNVVFITSYCVSDTDENVQLMSNGYRSSNLQQDESRTRFASLHNILADFNLDNVSAPVAQWVLQLCNLAADVTAERVLVTHTDASRPDVFTRALFYWLNMHLSASPGGWSCALGLLPEWSSTLEDLALAARDAMCVDK
jgi:hypothetical protein